MGDKNGLETMMRVIVSEATTEGFQSLREGLQDNHNRLVAWLEAMFVALEQFTGDASSSKSTAPIFLPPNSKKHLETLPGSARELREQLQDIQKAADSECNM